MVSVFRRSLSFPNKPTPNRPSKPSLSRHTRSISLPCRSHPLISQLKDHITELQSWSSTCDSSSAWLVDGLNRLTELHHCLDDTLQLPQTQEALRRQPHYSSVENLLEQFLRFVDVYGIFRSSVLALKEEHSAVQVALRKRNESKVALYMKARKRMSNEMSKLVNEVRHCTRSSESVSPNSVNVGDVELAVVVTDVVQVTVMVSVALFNGIALSLGPRKSTTWRNMGIMKKGKVDDQYQGIHEFEQVGIRSLLGLRKKGAEEFKATWKNMRELEISIEGIETCTERVFRSLINARVALLNILTS
ncbi:uncharacterized protein LOC126784328 [Argentina anserina]|uniref:uncharacterized protein LOC126784328 n=1 Tax=Argentina anserina TaxID=57926 RepID=UPI0021763EF0|nr:uncharacterized protein LOC126784328 [Potentilla anserina]